MSAEPVPIFDAAQLVRATNGDTSMQVEILALFLTEAERLIRQVEDAEDPEIRGDRLRALIALARNTGAVKLASAARTLEQDIALDAPDLTPLREAVEETMAYVRQVGF